MESKYYASMVRGIMTDPISLAIRVIYVGLHVCILVTLIVGTATNVVHADAPARPNIVLIVADDLGYSDLGCYGGEIRTPNLDRLANRGLRMTRFYNACRCNVTRASLLTGLYWQQAMRPEQYFLSDNAPTIAEVLRDSGYMTAISGKWHLSNAIDSEQAPLGRGFDRFFGTIKGAGSFFDPESLCRNRKAIAPGDDFYYTDAISDEAIDCVRAASAAQRPLFLYVAYTAPHWPLHARNEDIARYHGHYEKGWDATRKARHSKMKSIGIVPEHGVLSDLDTRLDWEMNPERKWHERRMEVYAAMVDRMDHGIGRIVKSLEDSGQIENTLLMFLSDNGGCSEDVKDPLATRCLGGTPTTRSGSPITTGPVPGLMPGSETTFQAYGQIWANVSNTPFKKYKSSCYEGGIRTPFIMHWPKGIDRAGTIIKQPAHVIDVLPTCLDVASATYPMEFGGRPLPALPGASLLRLPEADEKPRTIYQQFGSGAALQQGKWKIVTTNFNAGPWHLYDMDADGTEIDDHSKESPELLAELVENWRQWADRVSVRP